MPDGSPCGRVDVAFRLRGTHIPADHGYLLYAALSRLLPLLHAPETEGTSRRVAIHPIRGRLTGERRLALLPESRLIMRADASTVGSFLPLVGQTLELAGNPVEVHPPELLPLRPVARLYSRLVVIKGFLEPSLFLEAAQRQLAAAGITADIGIPLTRGTVSREGHVKREQTAVVRRTLRVRDKEIVGYAVVATGLTAEASLQLQDVGLGGRRHFGCGVFIPAS